MLFNRYTFRFRAFSTGVSVQQDLSDISGPGLSLNFRARNPKSAARAGGNSIIHFSRLCTTSSAILKNKYF